MSPEPRGQPLRLARAHQRIASTNGHQGGLSMTHVPERHVGRTAGSSIVHGTASPVQGTSRQSDACSTGTASSAWQQLAGAQSASSTQPELSSAGASPHPARNATMRPIRMSIRQRLVRTDRSYLTVGDDANGGPLRGAGFQVRVPATQRRLAGSLPSSQRKACATPGRARPPMGAPWRAWFMVIAQRCP